MSVYVWKLEAEVSSLPISAQASHKFFENSGIFRNRVRLPPGVIISRIPEFQDFSVFIPPLVLSPV